MGFWIKEWRSFQAAFQGFRWAWREAHVRFHALMTVVVTVLAVYLKVSRIDWMLLILCIGLVWCAEMVNTALEMILDLLHPEEHPLVGKAKDLAAGAVLCCSITAAVVGLVLFYPYLSTWWTDVLHW